VGQAHRCLLTVPRHRRRTLGRRSFSVAGPTAWNFLPDQPRDSDCTVHIPTVTEDIPLQTVLVRPARQCIYFCTITIHILLTYLLFTYCYAQQIMTPNTDQVQIFACFTEEEALHSILIIFLCNIMHCCIATSETMTNCSAAETIQNKKVEFFPSRVAHRAALISVSIALSQTPADTAKPLRASASRGVSVYSPAVRPVPNYTVW